MSTEIFDTGSENNGAIPKEPECVNEKNNESFLLLRIKTIYSEIIDENIEKKKNNVIKFICCRSFHADFSIKIEWNGNEHYGIYVLNTCSLNIKNVKHYEKLIEKKHIKKLLSLIDKYKYFDESNYIKRLGLDGSDWTTEIKLGGKYKKLTIWSPDDGVVYLIGKYLIDLSEIDLGPIY